MTLCLQAWTTAPIWLGYEWTNTSWHQCYRIISCNWLHFSWNHLAWDLAVFFVLGAMCEMRGRSRYALMLITSSILIPIVISVAHPELSAYRGLSGIDSGLFALLGLDLALEHIGRNDWPMASLFAFSLVALVCKLGWEMHTSGNLFVSDQSFMPVPLAHITGVIIGLVYAASGIRSSHPGPLVPPKASVLAKP
jgi:rhomboid family GlyGly-CTERM serine protease